MRMKANESLSKIPVVTSSQPERRDNLKWQRSAVKFFALLVILLIPVLGIFRIDVSSGFVVLGKQIWFSDFHIVFGFWLAFACLAIMFYSTVGTAFCGWVCPQNTFSGLMDSLTKKLLGKRAVIDWESLGSKVASKKNTFINWVLLSIGIFLSSMVVALIPLIYFISPDAIWSFLTLQPHHSISNSLYWIYAVFVFVTAVNLGVVRHYFCRFMCVYRMWQFLFKTSDALHIDYDASRKDDCAKCNYCVTACMVDIDPRNTNTFDSCTNCGACITACNDVHAKKKEPGLLKFRFGKRRNKEHLAQRSIATLKKRSGWVLPVMALGIAMFAWGLYTYQPYHLAVYKSEKSQGQQIDEYRINVANKLYQPGEVSIKIKGLNPEEYELTAKKLIFDEVGRKDAFVTIKPDLAPGLHSFIVEVSSADGWTNNIRMQHFVKNG